MTTTNGDLRREFENSVHDVDGNAVPFTNDIARALWVGQRLGEIEGGRNALTSAAEELGQIGRFDTRAVMADREYADWLRERAQMFYPKPTDSTKEAASD